MSIGSMIVGEVVVELDLEFLKKYKVDETFIRNYDNNVKVEKDGDIIVLRGDYDTLQKLHKNLLKHEKKFPQKVDKGNTNSNKVNQEEASSNTKFNKRLQKNLVTIADVHSLGSETETKHTSESKVGLKKDGSTFSSLSNIGGKKKKGTIAAKFSETVVGNRNDEYATTRNKKPERKGGDYDDDTKEDQLHVSHDNDTMESVTSTDVSKDRKIKIYESKDQIGQDEMIKDDPDYDGKSLPQDNGINGISDSSGENNGDGGVAGTNKKNNDPSLSINPSPILTFAQNANRGPNELKGMFPGGDNDGKDDGIESSCEHGRDDFKLTVDNNEVFKRKHGKKVISRQSNDGNNKKFDNVDKSKKIKLGNERSEDESSGFFKHKNVVDKTSQEKFDTKNNDNNNNCGDKCIDEASDRNLSDVDEKEGDDQVDKLSERVNDDGLSSNRQMREGKLRVYESKENEKKTVNEASNKTRSYDVTASDKNMNSEVEKYQGDSDDQGSDKSFVILEHSNHDEEDTTDRNDDCTSYASSE